MALDFRADQVRTNKLITSGSTGTNAQFLVYPFSKASNSSGGINSSLFGTSSIGSDVFVYISGSIGSVSQGNSHGVAAFGGDVFVSGTLNFPYNTSIQFYNSVGDRHSNGLSHLSAPFFGGIVDVFALGDGHSNAVVFLGTGAGNNILGYLQYPSSSYFSGSVSFPQGIFARSSDTATTASALPASGAVGLSYSSKISSRNDADNTWVDLLKLSTVGGSLPNILSIGDPTNLVGGIGFFVSGTSGNSLFYILSDQSINIGASQTSVTKFQGGVYKKSRVKTNVFTASLTDDPHYGLSSSAGFNVTLNHSDPADTEYVFWDYTGNAATNPFTFTDSAGGTINGSSTAFQLNVNYGSVIFKRLSGANSWLANAAAASSAPAGTKGRLFIGRYTTTTNTSSNPQACGQNAWNPKDWGFVSGSSSVTLQAILSAQTGSASAFVKLYNVTSGVYVDIGGTGVTALSTSNTTATKMTSVNLAGVNGFYLFGEQIYEVQIYTSVTASTTFLGSSELITVV
jgi:hypothetical protein